MLSCQIYDYLEIACIYRYRVRLTPKEGEPVEGTALDTRRNGEKECLLLRTETGETLVPLETLHRMEALQANPHFSTVDL